MSVPEDTKNAVIWAIRHRKLSYSQAAQEYGLTHGQVGGIMERRPGRLTEEDSKRGSPETPDVTYGVALVADGFPVARAAEKAEVDQTGLYRAVKKSIVREVKELQTLPPGAQVETAWDYSSRRVQRVLREFNLPIPNCFLDQKAA